MLASISKFMLKLFGWTLVGYLPTNTKYLVIVAPHTSNWDFFIFLGVKWAYELKIVFIGKHTLFIGPVGWALRKVGGIPVDRSGGHNMVDTIVNEFNKRGQMVFALSPEGTRSYLDHWKSGFYHIARKANVPIQMAFVDNMTKTIGWGPLYFPSNDKEKDLKQIQEFYNDKVGIKPEKFSKIVFRASNQ